MLRNVGVHKDIAASTKIKIFNTCVKFILLYGYQTWLVSMKSDSMKRKLQTFINRCLRYILRIWWPKIISNDKLLKITNQINVIMEIKRKKFGQIGYTLRKDNNEPCKVALQWNLYTGYRKRGRPRNTWHRVVLEESDEGG